jgi:MlaC protein
MERDSRGDWRVHDVLVEGISLLDNYRTQFASVIARSSYEGLVQRLRSRVQEHGRAAQLHQTAPSSVTPMTTALCHDASVSARSSRTGVEGRSAPVRGVVDHPGSTPS